eukprot:284819388_4
MFVTTKVWWSNVWSEFGIRATDQATFAKASRALSGVETTVGRNLGSCYCPVEVCMGFLFCICEEERREMAHMFRLTINKIMQADAYSVPFLLECLHQEAHARHASIDLQAYINIKIQEESRSTAIMTAKGSFESTVLPFSIKNSPAEFQRIVDPIFGNLYANESLFTLTRSYSRILRPDYWSGILSWDGVVMRDSMSNWVRVSRPRFRCDILSEGMGFIVIEKWWQRKKQGHQRIMTSFDLSLGLLGICDGLFLFLISWYFSPSQRRARDTNGTLHVKRYLIPSKRTGNSCFALFPRHRPIRHNHQFFKHENRKRFHQVDEDLVLL